MTAKPTGNLKLENLENRVVIKMRWPTIEQFSLIIGTKTQFINYMSYNKLEESDLALSKSI